MEEENKTNGVFVPRGNENYFAQYPELKEIEEFKNLTEPEMKFVFFHYSPHSPFVRSKPADRFVQSTDMSFTNGSSKNAFAPTDIPEKIVLAGERMSQVNVGLRTQADMVVKQMFHNLKAIITIDEKTIVSMDIDEKKKYVAMAKDATSALSEMISTMERGFGLKPVSYGKSKEELKEAKKDYDAERNLKKKVVNLADAAIEKSKSK